MSKTVMLQYLENVSLFKFLTDEEKARLAENCTIIKYKKGETICKQGSFANHIVFLTDGLGKNYIEGSNDKNLIIEIVRPFELFGLTSLFKENVFHLSLASITETNVCFIGKKIFADITEGNNIISKNIIEYFCVKAEHYFKKIAGLGNKQLHGRFADAILYLSKEIAQSKVLELSITRKELGELAGISTESAIRLLSELNHDGIIKLEGKKITLIKDNLLEKLSEIG
ncbi:MAG: Crp/Fnr family transcriptional regulator [Bacteroidales bacterium]|nr:Crp/Fnr family transcriptional regulator [Bacteroidales bacterium]